MRARAVGALALTAWLAVELPARAEDASDRAAASDREVAAPDEPVGEAPRGAPAKREEILVEAPGGDLSAPKSQFCWACVLVGGGTLLVLGAIPLVVRATSLASRADGVGLGRAALGCGDGGTAACGALEAADTDVTPWAASAGVVGGLGLVSIVSGALLGYAVPARDGGGISLDVQPSSGIGAVLGLRGAF